MRRTASTILLILACCALSAGAASWFDPVLGKMLSIFRPATQQAAGKPGIVPAPAAGDQAKFLRGDGTWAAGGSGGSAWGAITGTLSNQTDLSSALNGKATSAQGAKADTALQAEADTLATVTGRGASTTHAITLGGASPLVFDGATGGTFTTTISVTDPTANNTVTLKNASGTLAFTSDIPTESDTLASVTGRGASSTVTIALTGSAPLVLGEDKSGGTPNTAGSLKLFSAGDNAYCTTITAGEQTQNVAYTLPLDDGNSGQVLTTNGSGVLSWSAAAGGGYTNLTQFVDQTAWRIFYANTDGDVVELSLGSSGTYLKSNGASAAPTWGTPSGGSGENRTPSALTFATPLVAACGDGFYRKTTATSAFTLGPPTGANEGDRWEILLTCDATPRAMTLDSAIVIPSDSTFTSPKTLTASKSYIVVLKYGGSAWWLVSCIGGY